MITKICKECNIEKNNLDFYKHPQGKLGTLPRCKECIKKGRKTERERVMARISDKKRNKTNKRKLFNNKRRIQFRLNNPEKYKAHKIINLIFRKFPELKPNKCFVSGVNIGIIHMHHFDYNKPNEVIPCTPKIHSDFHHGKINMIKEEWKLVLPFNS